MRTRTRLVTSLALFAMFGVPSIGHASSPSSMQDDALRALDGEWIYVEDRTEGRAREEHSGWEEVELGEAGA